MKKLILIICFTCISTICRAEITITPIEKWSNTFSGKEVVFHFHISTDKNLNGIVGWRYSFSGRTLFRGENVINIGVGQAETIEIRLIAPDIKAGIERKTVLSVDIFESDTKKRIGEVNKDIWVFSKNPYLYKKQWLNDLKISLFDPEKKTSKIFTAVSIPFIEKNNIDSISAINKGIIIIGEDISFRDYRSLFKILLQKAASGIPVLCLAPTDGEVIIPGVVNSDLHQPLSVNFSKNRIIKNFDKRLDSELWANNQKIIKSSIKIYGEKGYVLTDIVKNNEGWPWVELAYGKNKGALVICGFGIIENWKNSPTPRYFLAAILADLFKPESR